VQWLRDNLGMISSAREVEQLAATVEDNGGAYFVPAFAGLYAPYDRTDARGALVGLTRYVNKGHVARAALEATAFQTREVLDAMNADSGVALTEVMVDGGMVGNENLMQFQADILGVPVVRTGATDQVALGAAFAAGIAVGFWSGEQDVIDRRVEDKRWTPAMDPDERARQLRLWRKAVTRTFDWVEDPEPALFSSETLSSETDSEERSAAE
jgi:glycerol kinase